MMSKPKPASNKSVIGWREWVSLPLLGIDAIKPKIDTGARSSSLHAFDLELYQRNGTTIAQFQVHPFQRDFRTTVTAEAEVLEFRKVKSSSGHVTRRPVIVTDVELLGHRWPIELTLANRDEMGFRMLLGREAVRDRFLVDAGRSYYAGKPVRQSGTSKKREKRKRTKSKETGKEKP